MRVPTDNPKSTASVAGHPIHPMLVPFPIVCFIGAWLTDIAYANTYDPAWATSSSWLLTVGLIMAVFAVIAGAIDYFSDSPIRSYPAAKVHVIGNIVALVLTIINAFVHSRDGYTSVVPTGITLSTIVVVILGVTAWTGGTLVYRHGVGVK
jgi:uncharacterized membrane protein